MRLKKETNLIKLLSIKYFGKLAEKHSKYFDSLRQPILEADLKILFRSYVSMVMFTTSVIYVFAFLSTLFYSILFGF